VVVLFGAYRISPLRWYGVLTQAGAFDVPLRWGDEFLEGSLSWTHVFEFHVCFEKDNHKGLSESSAGTQ